MSEFPQYPTTAPTLPEPERKSKVTVILIALLIGAVFFAIGFSSSALSIAAKPAVQLPGKVVTKTYTVYKTPQSCLDALDNSDKIIDLLTDTVTTVPDAMDAIAASDYNKLDTYTAHIKSNNSQILEYNPMRTTYSAGCRANQ